MKHISEILPKALEGFTKDQLNFQILNIFPDYTPVTDNELEKIAMFIDKCSLSDFEKLKDLDLSQNKDL